MRKVDPYRSFDGASRALDNGGRPWNLFTHAADRVITRAEIGKAGGAGGWAAKLVFFDLVTSCLDEGEREELARRLEPKLRARWLRERPVHRPCGDLRPEDEPKRPRVVEGRVRRVAAGDDRVGCVPVTVIVANVPMTSMVPATKVHDVFEVGEGGDTCLVLARRGTSMEEGRRARFGGLLKKGTASGAKGAPPRHFLDASFWLPLE
jgi:hypothetical protein